MGMKAWRWPHNSRHWPWMTPSRSALNQISLSRPGIASMVKPRDGTPQECITSDDVTWTRMTLFTGTTMSLSVASNRN
jgi:hypothetical protein